ncbi:hypothetical protein [Nocardia sp. NPDC005366]|uniref:hypothetical protein n=1 Tax=Nocardia sp. NPDC005366 TaxID=3156878 RepID=UPI0033A423E1
MSNCTRRLTWQRLAPFVGGFVPLPERGELVVFDDVGGEQVVAAGRVVARAVDHRLAQFGQCQHRRTGYLVAQRVTQRGTQAEGMRARLYETGPVGGVLHAVGEHERLFLVGVEFGVAEHIRQCHRQLRRDRAAQEAG